MRILVVVDERTIRFSLSELLADDGHEVREAEHAPTALERHAGNVSQTAWGLGLHRQSLQKKLRQLGIERE